ncbi:hypothetical protein DAC17_107 [Bacteroides phage DAC17]|nr:hypothetical protein DAC17_107 [Bacteroides phage DAC17]
MQLTVAFILAIIAGVFGIALLFLSAKEPFLPAARVFDYVIDL